MFPLKWETDSDRNIHTEKNKRRQEIGREGEGRDRQRKRERGDRQRE